MDASNTIGELVAALSKAQGQMKPASVDGKADTGKYKYTYASLASVMDAIRKPLTDNGLAVIQRTDCDDGGVFLDTILAHSSGEWMASRLFVCTIGTPAQQMGSALTYSRRYALSAMVGVVTDEDDDGQKATEGQRQTTQPQRQPQPTNGKQAQDPPGFDVWADWRNANDAKAWAMTQGKFNAQQHMERGYEKCKADCQPANAKAMWQCWYEYVTAHEPAKAQATDGDADPAWAAIDAASVDEPQFS
jgi:hypothetical protein